MVPYIYYGYVSTYSYIATPAGNKDMHTHICVYKNLTYIQKKCRFLLFVSPRRPAWPRRLDRSGHNKTGGKKPWFSPFLPGTVGAS